MSRYAGIFTESWAKNTELERRVHAINGAIDKVESLVIVQTKRPINDSCKVKPKLYGHATKWRLSTC